MKPLTAAAIVALGLVLTRALPAAADLRGFAPPDAARELALENTFADIPSAQQALDTVTALAARAHPAGSPGDYALALDVRDRLRAAGISAELEPYPGRVEAVRKLLLELAPPADLAAPPPRRGARRAAFPVSLDLREPAIAGDPGSGPRDLGLPFDAGSADGDVSAPLVYADRGLDEDYATLAHAGVDVRGAVVLVRYGAQFRGLLAERAQAHAAAAVIFYSDPKDDGSGRGAVYPDGPWRPAGSVERGWVGPSIHIPVVPVSAANARILLDALRGVPGPPGWGGALPVDYPLARGPGRVHLRVKLDRRQTTLWNTIGIIPGAHAQQTVILGAHRDAWTPGAGNNGAGVATLVEVARGFGFLASGGWRPQRTIVLAAWDGGDLDRSGSRAYALRHRATLLRGGLAYLNADTPVTGPTFTAAASAALAPLVAGAGHAVRDSGAPLAIPVGAPGGADGETFVFDTGTPVASFALRGPFGVDRSAADTPAFAVRFSDPDFRFHRVAAQLYGVLALRLADAGTIPYAFGGYAPRLRDGLGRLVTRAAPTAPFDAGAVRRAIDRFAAAAAKRDRGAPRATDDDGVARALAAVRDIGGLLYGASASASVTFPALDAAVEAGDSAREAAAAAETVAQLDRAAAALRP